MRYGGEDKVPAEWCNGLNSTLAITGINGSREYDAGMYSTACLEILCIYKSAANTRRYIRGSNRELCNLPGNIRLAVIIWGLFAACLAAIVVIGVAKKYLSCWTDSSSDCCCTAVLPSYSQAEGGSSRSNKLLAWLLAVWRNVLQGKLKALVLLGGLVFDVVTDIFQFIAILPNKFAYLLLAALFLPTIVAGGIWHLTRPRGSVPGPPYRRWLAAMSLALTTPIMAVAWGLWLNVGVAAAVAINLAQRRPAMQRPPWLPVDMYKYAHVFNVFTALLEDTLSAAFTTAAYLTYDKNLLGVVTTDTMFMLSLLGSMVHMLISAWAFKSVLLTQQYAARSSTAGSFGSMLRSLWSLAPDSGGAGGLC
jgi:hypothetical protein